MIGPFFRSPSGRVCSALLSTLVCASFPVRASEGPHHDQQGIDLDFVAIRGQQVFPATKRVEGQYELKSKPYGMPPHGQTPEIFGSGFLARVKHDRQERCLLFTAGHVLQSLGALEADLVQADGYIATIRLNLNTFGTNGPDRPSDLRIEVLSLPTTDVDVVAMILPKDYQQHSCRSKQTIQTFDHHLADGAIPVSLMQHAVYMVGAHHVPVNAAMTHNAVRTHPISVVSGTTTTAYPNPHPLQHLSLGVPTVGIISNQRLRPGMSGGPVLLRSEPNTGENLTQLRIVGVVTGTYLDSHTSVTTATLIPTELVESSPLAWQDYATHRRMKTPATRLRTNVDFQISRAPVPERVSIRATQSRLPCQPRTNSFDESRHYDISIRTQPHCFCRYALAIPRPLSLSTTESEVNLLGLNKYDPSKKFEKIAEFHEHHNWLEASAWVYGVLDFQIEGLDESSVENLIAREQVHLDVYCEEFH